MDAIQEKSARRRKMALGVLLCLFSFSCSSPAPVPQAPPLAQVHDGELLFAKGKTALLRGDGIRAEQYLKMALEKGVHKRETVMLLVRVCLANSRLRAALNYAEPYLLEQPDEHALRYLVATVQLSLGNSRVAFRQLQHLSMRNPGYADAHYLRGVLHFELDHDAAKKELELYLSLAPNGARASEVNSLLAELKLKPMAPATLGEAVAIVVPRREEPIDNLTHLPEQDVKQ